MTAKDEETRLKQARHRALLASRARFKQTELVEEIVATGKCIAAAKVGGEPIAKTDPVSRLLAVIERAPYCCSISDAARLLRQPRQRVHETARKAEIAGLVELAANSDDRRILQLFLTRTGRSRLAAARAIENQWRNVLLNGLDEHRLATTVHVLRVIRQRLLRDERERRGR
jgi:DNA-binding MarR family transcriptional regulator